MFDAPIAEGGSVPPSSAAVMTSAGRSICTPSEYVYASRGEYAGGSTSLCCAPAPNAAVDDASGGGEPGTVLEARGDRLAVECGGGSRLVARELQLEGKRRMGTRDFLNGVRLEPGMRLGAGT